MSTKQLYDAALGDSDKSFIVPTGRRYRLLYGQITLTSTAVVGDRRIAIEIIDAASNIAYKSISGAVQAASLTNEYHLTVNQSRELAFIAGHIAVPVPQELILLPGWSFRVYDTVAVDPAADDMIVNLVIDERSMTRADPDSG